MTMSNIAEVFLPCLSHRVKIKECSGAANIGKSKEKQTKEKQRKSKKGKANKGKANIGKTK